MVIHKGGKMNKKIKHIMFFLVILLLILFFLLIFVKRKNNRIEKIEEKLQYINNDEWNNEIYPDGMPKLFRSYSGELTAQNMGKSIYFFTMEIIPKYYAELKNANDKEILSYYNANVEIIARETGIEKKQNFQDLIVNVQKLNAKELIFSSFRIDKNSIQSSNQYTEATLYITYQENEEIGFSMKINASTKEKSNSIIYTALEK